MSVCQQRKLNFLKNGWRKEHRIIPAMKMQVGVIYRMPNSALSFSRCFRLNVRVFTVATSRRGGVALTSYAEVKSVALNGKLYAALTRTTNWMPKGGPKLDDCSLQKIQFWIGAGAPQN